MSQFVFRCLAMACSALAATAFAQQAPASQFETACPGRNATERLPIGMVRLSTFCRRESHFVEGRQRRGPPHRRLAHLLAREPERAIVRQRRRGAVRACDQGLRQKAAE